jgi:hypothetical protein
LSYRVESILARGSRKVVFSLRNQTSGEEDRVLKIANAAFDPKQPLIDALPIAAVDLRSNPDRIIRICTRILHLDPRAEFAAFNKGVAHLVKMEFSLALESLDLSVAIDPRDPLNLIHRASCLASLGRDPECLRDLVEAGRQHGAQLDQYLLQVPGHASNIRRAIARLSRSRPHAERARWALREFFGLSTRIRLALRQLRHRGTP